jgi:hypothetical protein
MAPSQNPDVFHSRSKHYPQMSTDLRRRKRIVSPQSSAPSCIANRQNLREPGRIRNNHACLVGLSSTKRHELHECCSNPHPYSWHSCNSWFKRWFRPTAGLGPLRTTCSPSANSANSAFKFVCSPWRTLSNKMSPYFVASWARETLRFTHVSPRAIDKMRE